MARLRKPSPLEPVIFAQPTPSRATRSSPRKAVREISYAVSSDEEEENVLLRPKPSKRDLGDASSVFQEDSFFTAKTCASPSALNLTPRKQRILRPVKSNSRLLRKLSDESLASPEKRPDSERRAGRVRRERSGTHEIDLDLGRKRNLMYAKSLARSVAGRELKKSSSRITMLDDETLHDPTNTRKEKDETSVEVEAEEDEETSILCGDEEDVAQEAEQQQVETNSIEDPAVDLEDEDDDEDVVLPVRSRARRPQRRVNSDSESEYEEVTADDGEDQEEEKFEEPQPLLSMRPPHRKGHSTISNWAQEVVDLTSSPKAPHSFVLPDSTRARSSSLAASRPATSSSDAPLAILTYSPTPTKKRSPCKAPPLSRPATPPLAPPSPTKLVSPSKKKPLIPKAPDLRPSLDAFWNPEVVNDWNDRHSPAKPLVSPGKQRWRNDVVKMMGGLDLEDGCSSDDGYTSPVASPRKKATRPSPTKKASSGTSTPTVQDIRAQRKDFAAKKHDIATTFLTELDTTICSGRITALSSSTGGIKLLWSNTLKTTAGRANWRREAIRVRNPGEPPSYTTTTRHHCSIELASKVIDDETRLYNVLAHEFCHLATFMIDEVRNNPHGAAFKAWGRKASLAFRDRGVEVTTKHSYAIEYKYIWECVACGYEFKRHSKSVDPGRHSCGKCKGRLVQTKPLPRSGGGGEMGERKQSEYQVFVKKHFATVKAEMAASGLETQMGKVMEVVARRYREGKEKEGQRKEVEVVEVEGVDGLDEALEGLKL